MNKLIRENRIYFSLFLLFMLVVGILLFFISTGDVVFFFSDRRSAFGDFFFKYFTKLGEHILYIGFIIGFLFYRFRWSLLIVLNGLAVFVISVITKSYFAHPRPAALLRVMGKFEEVNTIEGVKLLSGQTSFPSGHTMSAFATYGLVAFLLSKKNPWGWILFLIALGVGISRIYLVQHFLKDVYFGAFLGTAIAAICFLVNDQFPYNENRFIDRSLLSWKRKPGQA